MTPAFGSWRHQALDLLRAAGLILRMCYRGSLPLTLVAMVVTPAAMVFGLLGALWVKLLADGVLRHDARQALGAAGLMALSGGAMFFVNRAGFQVMLRVTELAGLEFDRLLVRVVTGIPTMEHHERPAYLDRLKRLQDDASQLREATSVLIALTVSVVNAGVALVLLGRLAPLLLLLPLFWLPRQASNAAVLRWLGEQEERDAEPLRALDHLEKLAATPATAQEVLISGLEEELLARHRRLRHEVASHRLAAHWRGTRLQLATTAFAALSYAGALVLMAVRAGQGQATVGDVLMAVVLVGSLTNALSMTAYQSSWLLQAVRRVIDLSWLLDYARTVPAGGVRRPPASLRESVRFSGVSFRYPGTERWVLRDVELELESGSVVALVGENGAGKTTLIKLLCRFYDPTEGAISVDGTDLREFAYASWRERLAAGYQDFVRFELLARETVGIGDLPRMEVRGAVGRALVQAGGEAVTDSLPRGMETPLGRRWDGVELSGGQWQRLALARAFMRERPLLLMLDEPTSALDAPTEHALFERFADAARRVRDAGTITLLVSHRFSTVRMADRIVVIDAGRVREQGTHDELVRAGGLYAELYELQARSYR